MAESYAGTLPPMTQAEAVRIVGEQIDRIGSQALAAEVWGVSRPFLCLVLAGKRNLGPKLCQALGLTCTRYIVYRYAPTPSAKGIH